MFYISIWAYIGPDLVYLSSDTWSRSTFRVLWHRQSMVHIYVRSSSGLELVQIHIKSNRPQSDSRVAHSDTDWFTSMSGAILVWKWSRFKSRPFCHSLVHIWSRLISRSFWHSLVHIKPGLDSHLQHSAMVWFISVSFGMLSCYLHILKLGKEVC